jgi:acetylglutamate kinase
LKLLLKLAGSEGDDVVSVRRLAGCVRNLVSAGHRVVLVHDHDENQISLGQESMEPGLETAEACNRGMGAAIRANKLLVSMLNTTRVTAFGFCGFDGNLVQLRLGRPNGISEVAAVEALWFDVITEKGGVPVIANIGCRPDGTWKMLDSDQLAAQCAISWDADLLIFLVGEDGVRDCEGTVMRWLDAGNVDQIPRKSLGGSMMAKLNGCCIALEGGVRRARIYPASQIESLPDFYFARIDYGTEITMLAKSNSMP